MRNLLVGTVIAALLTSSVASAADPRPEIVRFRGCPTPGVEKGCVMIKKGAETYNITGATPPIEFKGLGVSGSGTVSSKISYCMQGKVLDDIHYTYTKLRCPKPEAVKAPEVAKKPAAPTK